MHVKNARIISNQFYFSADYSDQKGSLLVTYKIRNGNNINQRHYRNHNARYDASTKLCHNQQHCASKRSANCTRE